MDSTLIFTDEMSNVHRSYSPKDTFTSGAVSLSRETLVYASNIQQIGY